MAEVRTSAETKQEIEEFIKRYIVLLKAKKDIDSSIKDLKSEYAENGVAVGIVCRVFNKVKANKKKSDSERFEEDTIMEWLESNAEIDSDIGELVSK